MTVQCVYNSVCLYTHMSICGNDPTVCKYFHCGSMEITPRGRHALRVKAVTSIYSAPATEACVWRTVVLRIVDFVLLRNQWQVGSKPLVDVTHDHVTMRQLIPPHFIVSLSDIFDIFDALGINI